MKAETYFEPAEVHLKTTRWHAVAAVSVVSLAILFLYWDMVVSILSIWRRTETYTHCFLVPAIVVWLVWRQHSDLKNVEVRPWATPLVGMALAGTIWLAASAAGVQVVSQFAVLLMLELALSAIVGLPMTKRLLFPLAFAFFAIPAGEVFVPTMIDWTANVTIEALRLTGVPVYREGNNFIIPSGRWSVVEACSGIRYLIASFMAGTLFAYLMYRTMRRRLAFIAASLAFPIVANWLRAYLIVMLGHLSNNKLAAGVDHLIYGWILFGVIMMLLFWAGARWQEVVPERQTASQKAVPQQSAPSPNLAKLWAIATLSIAVAAVWPIAEAGLNRSVLNTQPVLPPIVGQGGWNDAQRPVSDWTPNYSGASSTLRQTFEASGKTVGVLIAYYRGQTEGHELITTANTLVHGFPDRWIQSESGSRSLIWDGRPVEVNTAEVTDGVARLSVRYWFWVNGRITTSSLIAKLWLAHAKLTHQGDDSALVLLYASKPEFGNSTDAMFQDFTAKMAPAISQTLAQARGSGT